MTIFENDFIKVSTTDRDYDFIAVIENKTNQKICVHYDEPGYNDNYDPILIQPNGWVGLPANDEGCDWVETIFDDCDDITEAVWNEYLIDYTPLKDELVLDRERQPHMKLDNIKIEERIGTWYEIDHLTHNGVTYVLFESEIYGGDAPAVVIKYTDDRTRDGEIPEDCEICET